MIGVETPNGEWWKSGVVLNRDGLWLPQAESSRMIVFFSLLQRWYPLEVFHPDKISKNVSESSLWDAGTWRARLPNASRCARLAGEPRARPGARPGFSPRQPPAHCTARISGPRAKFAPGQLPSAPHYTRRTELERKRSIQLFHPRLDSRLLSTCQMRRPAPPA